MQNEPSITNNQRIGLSWIVVNDGGSPIIDYTISYDASTGSWEILDTVTINMYTTSVSLTSGRTYAFIIKARNSVGESASSQSISILAAQAPS